MDQKEIEKIGKQWNKLLKGKTIESVEYLDDKNTKAMMWNRKPVVITFTDGSFILPQSDGEGNDSGCLMYQAGKLNLTIHNL